MKITTRAEYQWDGERYQLIAEDSYEHNGPVALCKSKGNIFNKMAGGTVNRRLDPLDLFGGQERREALDATEAMPENLRSLNELQANVGRYNTSGPFGTSEWSIDPTTGRYTQTTNLGESQQRQFDSRNAIAEQMMNKAQEFAPASSSSFDYDREVPALAEQQYSKVASLLNPAMGEQQSAWDAKMKNAGVAPTTDAYREVAAQRGADTGDAQYQAKQAATTAAVPLAQQQRQQRMTELAQLMGAQQLNSPAMGGNGIDIAGATGAANQVGINNANLSAAQRNANMQSMAGLFQLAYPNGFGG